MDQPKRSDCRLLDHAAPGGQVEGSTLSEMEFLSGGGECGALIRALDWSATPLGRPETWPQSLKTTVSLLLNSRYPMFVFWGPQLVKIYNDAYRPITGNKHPWAFGRPAPEVWPEIWADIRPLVDRALAGEATWSDDLMLFMRRSGFPEEVYFTFSYSPIRDESGGVGGMFCACTETTPKVLGERRLRTLRDLALRPTEARSITDACAWSAEVLAGNPLDVPFALIYLLDGEGRSARLAAAAGVPPGQPLSPVTVDPGAGGTAGWPLLHIADHRHGERLDDLAERFPGRLPGPWPESPAAAMLLPLVARGQEQAAGVIVLGISARRVFDDDYRGWFELVAGQVASSIANARAYEQERKRAEALAELDHAKTLFFSDVSHEFRTPLTLMLGPLEDLLGAGPDLSPSTREQLALVHRNGVRLLKLVNTLLDFARIEAGRVDAVFEATELGAYTAELAGVFRAAVERAGLRLVVDCPPLPVPVYVDREMWEKVVLNLLSNAFKFTFEGEIAVSVRTVGDRAELVVRDTGVGIAADQLPHIFERFHRVRDTRSRTHEGTGIGLSLILELVRLHAGTISVASDPGTGTCFTVSLPLGTAHLPAERVGATRTLASTALGTTPYLVEALRWIPEAIQQDALPTGVASVPTRGAHILLADDNADMRGYVKRLLGRHWSVDAVADGAAALAAARARVPDLVLTDVMMPGLDGVQLLRALRADPRTRTVPVILLSARAGEESRVEGLEHGADDYVIKPFSGRELVARVNAHLETARLRRDALCREEAARGEAEAANRAKDDFLAVLSHELRTPLTTVTAWVRMLREGRVPEPEMSRALEVIDRNVQFQVRLIDDLLDVSRIATHRLTANLSRVELAPLVAAAVDALQHQALTAGVKLAADIEAFPEVVRGDAGRLQQVVANLVTNALKFTPAGGAVTVRVRRRGGLAILTVVDTGEGIPAHVLPRVFDRFWQRDATAHRLGGLGLGLAIVRHIVELHHGTVQAASDGPGRGATFTVELPLAL